ncbi:hypothetical protein Anas_04327, partial [Armadillidium nasatum]
KNPVHFSPEHHFVLDLKPYFIYPDILNSKSQVLKIKTKEHRLVSCPGKKNKFKDGEQKLKSLFCKLGKLVLQDKESIAEDINCKRRPMGSIRHTNIKCHGTKDGVFHVIGWKIDTNWFIPQIIVCWDGTRETTLFTKHIIHGQYLKNRVPSPGRPNFKREEFYSENIGEFYTHKFQENTFKFLLGRVSNIPGSRRYYFARGHLAPDADFVNPSEQDETYFYSNAIPQLQSFNNGNWKKVENSLRDLAMEKNRSLVVYSGTFGILTLKDERGKDVPIYLCPEKHLYPIPLIIWKVVHDPVAKEAVTILGLNTMTNEADKREAFFDTCDNICDQILWLEIDEEKDFRKGSILCCSWNQFKTNVAPLEDLGRPKLLKI